MKRQYTITIIITLLVLDVTFRLLKVYAPEYHIAALQVANFTMAALSLAVYALVTRQVANRPQAFVRGVYGASLLRLMVSMTAMLIYIVINRDTIHKPSVFVLFGIYAIYTAIETVILSKTAKKK
jgi:hypothetical protein